MEQIKGCKHYKRNCHVEAPCCRLFYSCKLCHDEQYIYKQSKCQVERMCFQKVQKLKCLLCNIEQQPTLNCKSCGVLFGKFGCLACKLYQNDNIKSKDIFHCNACGMCRRGNSSQYYHCYTCGYCLSISQKQLHKCIQKVTESSCPICLQSLKYSTQYYMSLPCGHLIHVQCLKQYKNINCPVCNMAIEKLGDQRNQEIEKMIQATKDNIPQELRDKKVSVLCSQCCHTTHNASFHFYGIKCEKCSTYNTRMI